MSNVAPQQPFHEENWERQIVQDHTSFNVTGRTITGKKECSAWLELSLKAQAC